MSVCELGELRIVRLQPAALLRDKINSSMPQAFGRGKALWLNCLYTEIERDISLYCECTTNKEKEWMLVLISSCYIAV